MLGASPATSEEEARGECKCPYHGGSRPANNRVGHIATAVTDVEGSQRRARPYGLLAICVVRRGIFVVRRSLVDGSRGRGKTPTSSEHRRALLSLFLPLWRASDDAF